MFILKWKFLTIFFVFSQWWYSIIRYIGTFSFEGIFSTRFRNPFSVFGAIFFLEVSISKYWFLIEISNIEFLTFLSGNPMLILGFKKTFRCKYLEIWLRFKKTPRLNIRQPWGITLKMDLIKALKASIYKNKIPEHVLIYEIRKSFLR